MWTTHPTCSERGKTYLLTQNVEIDRRKEADERDDHSGKIGKRGIKMACTKFGKVNIPFGGIRKEIVARGNSPNQHPESN
ncbi:hypothetical protein GQ457_08G016120 [Hibiscus cannabinus]